MDKRIRIGTRESKLAVWQAELVRSLCQDEGIQTALIYIKSEGDLDGTTPLYEMGVQGIFTRSLDSALLNHRIDIAVHSLKDVPIKMPHGIIQAAVLQRGPVHDLLVYKKDSPDSVRHLRGAAKIATSSLRRQAQWLSRFPGDSMFNIRGNIDTRLKTLDASHWDGAIFAQAGLERIGLRPTNSIILDWMLPAPGQGAILVTCREEDDFSYQAARAFNHLETQTCIEIERDFLSGLLGGCSTPIGALAEIRDGNVFFRGNICSLDGQQKVEIKKSALITNCGDLGKIAAAELLLNGGLQIQRDIIHA